MTKDDVAILDQVNKIEQDFQKLKVGLMLGGKVKKTGGGIYGEDKIVREVRRVREGLRNEKRRSTKRAQSFS